MQKTRRIALVVASVMTLTTLAVIPAGADPTPNRCLDPGGLDHVIDLDHTRIVSGATPSDAYVVPLSAPIVSGIEYSVFVHVYDGYDGREADPAADERLVIDFLDAGGAVITSTAANIDLFSGVAEAEDFGLRGVLFFARQAESLRVRHVLDGTGADAASGLGAVCVSLRIKSIFPDLTTTSTTTSSTTTSSTTTSTSTTTSSTTSTTSTSSTTTSSTTTVPDTTTTSTSTTSSTTTVPDTTTTSTSTTSSTTTVPDTTTTSTSTTSSTTTVPDTTTTSTSTTSSTTTVPDTTTTSTSTTSSTTTVPDTTTTTSTTSSTTTVPGTTTTSSSSTTTTAAPTTTTTVSVGGPTTSTTVPTQVLPEVETSETADPVDGTPTFTG